MGLVPFKKKPESQLTLLPPEDIMKGQNRRPEIITQPCWHRDFRLPVSRTVRHTFLLFINHLVFVIIIPTKMHLKYILKKKISLLNNFTFLGWHCGKERTCQCRRYERRGSIPVSGRSPGGGHDNLLQYSCLENIMDRRDLWAIDHRVTKSWTRLK